jgi:glycolate oxidase FAD binding subunit
MSDDLEEADAELHPKTVEGVVEAVRWAAGERVPLEIVGHASKRALGHPVHAAYTLNLSGLTGVTLYEPEELVLSAKAGTPISEIEDLLEKHHQEMQFEPADLGPLLGTASGQGTLGGMVSTNICGPRRLKYGSVRDHILGITAVSGRGEMFKSGGRVVKNVTGYDLAKGLTGGYGTLAVLTDVIIKVLPRAETEQTLVLKGLSDAEAGETMALAMGSNAEVSGAAHRPAGIEGANSTTLLRLEGFEPSVAYRIDNLSKQLKAFGQHERFDASTSKEQWRTVCDCSPFVSEPERCVWRISCTPNKGHAIVKAISQATNFDHYYDWQGGLIWMRMGEDGACSDIVRPAIRDHGGGHAMLVRADAATRKQTPVFEPQTAALAALSRKYRKNFDPHRVLNPGRMGT